MPRIKNQSDIDSISKLDVGDAIAYFGQTALMPAGQLMTINLLKLDLGIFKMRLLYEWYRIIQVELIVDSHKLINNRFNNIYIYNDTNIGRFITVTVRNVDTSKHSDIMHQNESAIQIYNDTGTFESKRPFDGVKLNSQSTLLEFIKESESSTPISSSGTSTTNKSRIRVNLPTGEKLYCDLKDI